MRARVLISLGALVAASCWCVLLLIVRKHEYGASGYPYLVWNLVLAWLPLVLAVQLVVTRAAGALVGWLVAIGSLFAASFGIYLGRVLRFNSWDVVRRPHRLLELAKLRLDDPFGNRYLIGFTLALGGVLALAYLG